MIQVAVAGSSGRMGRMLIEAVLQADDCRLSGALGRADDAVVGQDAGAFLGLTTGVVVTADVPAGLAGADVLIDFTRPQATLAHLQVCQQLGVQAVIGTTGFEADQKAEIAHIARHIGIVLAPNMSVGVNVVMRLLDQAARALGSGYDVEIIEAHHRHKVDAPSGTALQMGDVVASALGQRLSDCAVLARDGVGPARAPGSIGFASVRGGDIVGDHTVLFAGTGERIEISHKSSSRATYAEGSLRAARFLRSRGAGLYSMDDVLSTPA